MRNWWCEKKTALRSKSNVYVTVWDGDGNMLCDSIPVVPWSNLEEGDVLLIDVRLP